MRLHRWHAFVLLAGVTTAGCQGLPARRTVASNEPSLTVPKDPDATVVEAVPSRSVTFVDRHPLFSKPRDYYEKSGSNKIIKTAAATVVGVPVGLFGELKQIVVGTPPEVR